MSSASRYDRWVWLAGASLGGSTLITITVIAGLFIVARIVAETGLLQPGSTFFPTRNWSILQYLGWQNPTTLTSVFISGHLQMIHHDVRETFSVFGSHAIKMTDNTVYAGKSMSADGPVAGGSAGSCSSCLPACSSSATSPASPPCCGSNTNSPSRRSPPPKP